MPDFRSSSEKASDRQRRDAEQADYKRMYETVLADNKAILQRMGDLDAKYADALALVKQVQGRFEQLSREMNQKAEEMRDMGEQMHQTVSTGYSQQSELMDRFRVDISKRLEAAQSIAETSKDG